MSFTDKQITFATDIRSYYTIDKCDCGLSRNELK